ncbi:tetratricopeptide repeat protein [Aliikangiella maris]|uniref:Tetratricopeptide repeat protein n=2 Tax=Aliikangiella maris TaxID=3162458 RepID=A0ABV3MJ36_9GAMM
MPLNFNKIAFVIWLTLVCLLSACTHVPTRSSAEESPSESSQTGDPLIGQDNITTDSQQTPGQQTSGQSEVFEKAVDPMQVKIPKQLQQAYQQTNLLISENYQKAIEKLQQLQSQYPGQSGPSYRIARIYYQQKLWDKALKSLEKCLIINPQNYYALNLKGMVLREQGAFNLALQAYQQAIKVYPDHVESHLNLAILADIYLYDLPLALAHYENYRLLIKNSAQPQVNPKIDNWILDLKRRIPAN